METPFSSRFDNNVVSVRRRYVHGRTDRAGCILAILLLAFLLTATPLSAQLRVVELQNGMRLGPGMHSETDSVAVNAFGNANGGGQLQLKKILVLDNGLTAVYVNSSPNTVLSSSVSNEQPLEKIIFPAALEVARNGTQPSIRGVRSISKFSKYGRREFTIMTPRGDVTVIQGITELTPVYAKLEVLRTKTDQFVWDQRISPATIPKQKLREILFQALDVTKSGDWLRIVRFYMQAKRYLEAREVLSDALERFPLELADSRRLITQLDQLYAQQKFNEIRTFRDAGQRQIAAQLLLSFPSSSLPIETQIDLEREIEVTKQEIALTDSVVKALKERVEKLPPAEQQFIAATTQELFNEINLVTIARLSDFQVLRADTSIPNENLVAYGIGGWLLGPGAGIDNFAVAKSLIRVRDLVKEYLNVPAGPRREQILRELQSEEGAQPQYLARLLATMKPPHEIPSPNAEDPKGLYRLSVTRPGGAVVNYVAQVPPEYDPNQKYPCVLSMPGHGAAPELEVDIWCGKPIQGYRLGPATRRGYIIISPQWMTEKQTDYQYTEGEQDRILSCMRDALRKFSIDTDRVFVSGHLEGATAAWDLAVSHPDLWAGAILVSPTAGKYIQHYSENVIAPRNGEIPLATYIVYGQYDGTRFNDDNALASTANRYLSSSRYDSMVVEYRGAGRMLFSTEVGRITDWMELSTHRRVRAPRVIEAKTMRPGDRFFYWLEALSINPSATGNPYLFDPTVRGNFEAAILAGNNNGVVVSRIPSKSAVIWLSPEMVDFGRPITVRVRGDRETVQRASNKEIVQTMLEDVRQRADRMHVFWQKVVIE